MGAEKAMGAWCKWGSGEEERGEGTPGGRGKATGGKLFSKWLSFHKLAPGPLKSREEETLAVTGEGLGQFHS